MIDSFTADVIGLIGSALFIGAFAYANLTKTLNKAAFNLANLIGSILLLISLSVNFNLAAFVLETAWGAIAAAGLVMALRARKSASPSSTSPTPAPRASGRGDQ
ncbi:CBU_0592 family membrane protein [Croceibacterium selenioxidans]|uniref:CBU_0592 family membrane protein n=1 Tax=Croceibacterium selenioxidans TaxID=2838833 RepID=UPI0030843212